MTSGLSRPKEYLLKSLKENKLDTNGQLKKQQVVGLRGELQTEVTKMNLSDLV